VSVSLYLSLLPSLYTFVKPHRFHYTLPLFWISRYALSYQNHHVSSIVPTLLMPCSAVCAPSTLDIFGQHNFNPAQSTLKQQCSDAKYCSYPQAASSRSNMISMQSLLGMRGFCEHDTRTCSAGSDRITQHIVRFHRSATTNHRQPTRPCSDITVD
jgi:hypothetical protein